MEVSGKRKVGKREGGRAPGGERALSPQSVRQQVQVLTGRRQNTGEELTSLELEGM